MRRNLLPAVAALLMTGALSVAVAPSPHAAAEPARQAKVVKLEKPARIKSLFSAGQLLLGHTFTIGGLGSSVGAGATLSDPQRSAPVAWFASHLQQRAPGAALARFDVVNGSVGGSTVHDGVNRDWAILKRAHPDVVVLAYGMNDGAPAQFESGETYAGAMQDMQTLIGEIRKSGAVPVILTTPSAHTTRMNWAVDLEVQIPQQPAISTDRPVREVVLPGGATAPESTRHAAVNEGFRQIASALDVELIDVEPFWLRAVASRGEDALFSPGEFVHPDLLGHQLSYHAAIDAWLASTAPGF